MTPPRILIIPARRHIAEAYCEYLIRYLSDEFYFDIGYPPEVPYDAMKQRIRDRAESPFSKNPDDYDLIYPHFDTHWFLNPPENYAHKVATVLFEPAGPKFHDKIAVVAGTTPGSEKGLAGLYSKIHSLRFGIDTEMFKPLNMVRTDDLLHVGIVGNIQTPRRYNKELVVEALQGLEGMRLMFFPTTWAMHTRQDEIENMGGDTVIDNICGYENRWYPGLPNAYNQLDVLIRSDIDDGYHFPVFEAAACGVPVICMNNGNNQQLCDAGGGICIDAVKDRDLSRIAKEVREAVIHMRDNPISRKTMGFKAREEILMNWKWEYHIENWRKFFKEGVANAAAGNVQNLQQ